MADEEVQEADEGAQESSEAAEAGGKKKSRLPLILVAVVALVAAGAGGAFWAGVLPGFSGEKGGVETLGEDEGHGGGHEGGGHGGGGHAGHGGSGGSGLGATMTLDPFIVNLADANGKRYLKTNIALEFYRDEKPASVDAMVPQIRDSLLTLLTSKTFKEIRTPEGKQALREAIIGRLNQSLQGDLVKGVYFTEFIIQ